MAMLGTDETQLRTALAELQLHDHLCSIYEDSQEQLAVAIPFIRIGLDRGEKCIYIADHGTEATVRQAMHAEGIDVERAIATDRLVLRTKDDTYLRNGSFDPEWMFAFWAEATAEALSAGFSAMRANVETEWVLRGAPGIQRWIEYESRLTHVLADLDCSVLCQYNGRRCPPELVLDIIRTHPTVIYRGAVCRNLYYVPPDELLGTNRAAREVGRLLGNIRDREEVEYQRVRLDSITDAALAYLSLDDLLRELLARLRSALGAEYAAIRVIDEEAQEFVLRAVDGAPFERVGSVRIPLESVRPLLSQAPYAIDELSQLGPDTAEWYQQLWSAIGLPLRAGMSAPLLVEGRPIGVVNVAATGTPFTEEDKSLLRVVADRVAPAIERGRLLEQMAAGHQRMAALSQRLVEVQESERRYIASELHDEVGQLLTSLLLKIESPSTSAGSSKAQMSSIVHDLIDRVSDLSMDLRPPMLDEFGLLPALLWQTDRFKTQTGVEVRFQHAGLARRFDAQFEITVFRIVQEALTNVARHAGVQQATVNVWAGPSLLRARIEDQGRGFDVEAALAARSSGLDGMRERSRLVGGRLTIESQPGKGTVLTLELPVEPATDPEEVDASG